MKNFKLMAVALVAILCLTACNNDCEHEFIEHDYSEALVGTWTYFADNGQAEAMVIKADGSFTTTGVMKGGSLYEEKGTIKVVNNKVSLVFDGDTDVIEGRLELVTGKSLSIVINEEYDIRLTYDYCKEDLSDEIVGMWVCVDGPSNKENDMLIQTYREDGTAIITGYMDMTDDYVINAEGTTYQVVGNILFTKLPANAEGVSYCWAMRLSYAPNGTAYGDILSIYNYLPTENGLVEEVNSFLRIKQSLDLTGKTYDYSSAYVSNAKGKDEDFNITGCTFNMAKIKATDFDMMFRAVLFCVELNANSIKQNFRPNGVDGGFETPITVDGNKVTLHMSAANPAYRDVDMYMFQDKDDTQLHIYMPTSSFINYMANLELVTMIIEGKIDAADATAVEKVYTDMEARVESINVSFVFKARK